ncbi:MAG: pyridoxamine 5'-phosphate oxidase [Chitinophagaceae bacterium]|nr:pyridoxamine 5'-phosphate oxidase [Chitinophagaceae bacterium]
MADSIAGIRKDYSQKALTEDGVNRDPMQQFDQWWREAISAAIVEPNAMTLATASVDGLPSARIVLLKGYSKDGFVFYTNYNSFKGKQLEENPKACLVFFWKELERQVRITGFVKKVSEQASDEYFFSRPIDSQIGAHISPQSQAIESREWLEEQFNIAKKKSALGESPGRPAHWGGYLVIPVIIEFWQGRPGRLHDRLEYSLSDTGEWGVERLAP